MVTAWNMRADPAMRRMAAVALPVSMVSQLAHVTVTVLTLVSRSSFWTSMTAPSATPESTGSATDSAPPLALYQLILPAPGATVVVSAAVAPSGVSTLTIIYSLPSGRRDSRGAVSVVGDGHSAAAAARDGPEGLLGGVEARAGRASKCALAGIGYGSRKDDSVARCVCGEGSPNGRIMFAVSLFPVQAVYGAMLRGCASMNSKVRSSQFRSTRTSRNP